MTERADEIRAIIEMSPNDPFPRYGLAMEYKAQGQNEQANQAFRELAERHPDYLPHYLMHGNLLRTMGQPEEAQRVYERGIQVATAQGNLHALGELRAALSALSNRDEEDDD